jgi:Fe2+ or Zn2+ uptake regulation protein
MADISAEQLIDDLRSAGLRITKPRRVICEVLASSHDAHLTPADLHAEAEAVAGSTISPSTVYRTIDTLESVGRLHHVHLGHGPAVLHLTDHGDHQHLVCEICGRTEDIPLDEMSGMIRALEKRYGFEVAGVHFALVGRCVSHRDGE